MNIISTFGGNSNSQDYTQQIVDTMKKTSTNTNNNNNNNNNNNINRKETVKTFFF